MRVFVGPSLSSALTETEFTALVKDFKTYKFSKKLPANFGRDVPYHWPAKAVQEELFHLHIAEESGWNHEISQYSRTSDVHLVYSRGFISVDSYVLLAILQPNAHAMARNRVIVEALANQAADFRANY